MYVSKDVGVNDTAIGLQGCFFQAAKQRDRRVVHPHVETPIGFHGLLGQRLHRLWIGHICGNGQTATAQPLTFRHHVLQAIGAAGSTNHDCAPARQSQCCGTANAARGARDHNDSVFHFPCHSDPFHLKNTGSRRRPPWGVSAVPGG